MATATFTEVVARVDQQLTNAIWADQIKDNINQLGGAHQNILVNGGFEVWQRGAGGFTTTLAYTADRWQMTNNLGVHTVTQETSIIDVTGASSLKSVTADTSCKVQQTIERHLDLRGKTISFSIRARQSVASAAQIFITDSSGTANGSTVATTGSFVTLTVSRTLGSGITSLVVGVAFTAAGTYYLDNAMLVVGPAPAPFQPLHPQEELARCQRYYEVIGGTNAAFPRAGGIATAGSQFIWVPIRHSVPKGGVPTVTKNGTWFVSNCSQPSVQYVNEQGFALGANSTAAGAVDFSPNTSDDTVTVEWNP